MKKVEEIDAKTELAEKYVEENAEEVAGEEADKKTVVEAGKKRRTLLGRKRMRKRRRNLQWKRWRKCQIKRWRKRGKEWRRRLLICLTGEYHSTAQPGDRLLTTRANGPPNCWSPHICSAAPEYMRTFRASFLP